jgi:hypothetical protein
MMGAVDAHDYRGRNCVLADQLGNRFVDLQFMFSMEWRALVERSLSVKQPESRTLRFALSGSL